MADESPAVDRDGALLLDMLTAARAVVAFVTGRTFAEYEQDLLLRSAVERQVEIISEAARSVSQTFKSVHPPDRLAPNHGAKAPLGPRIRGN
jgi:uncharacterized protein with HEPN domain